MKKIEFGQIAELRKERFDPNTENDNRKCVELEHIEQTSGRILGYVNSNEQKSTKNVFHKNDILFAKLRPYLRKYWLAEFDGVCSSEIWVLKPKKGIDKEYLFNLIQTEKFIKEANVSSGTKMPRADWNHIVNCSFLIVNSFSEQKSIADCLSTWDVGIEKLTQLIQAKKQQKKGLMQRLLTGTLRVTSASGEKFDGEWKEVRLGEIGETFNGLTGKTKDDFGEGFPYVSYLNVFNNNAIMETTIFDFVQIKEGENQTRLKYGDLIFTTSSETPDEVGMSGVMLFDPKQDLFLNSFCFGLRMENFEELEPNFAVYLLRGEQFRKEMYKLAQGSTRFNLSKAGFRKINLLVPPIKEQTAIAEILQAADKEIELLEQKLSVLQEQKKGLMQVLLTGEKRLID